MQRRARNCRNQYIPWKCKWLPRVQSLNREVPIPEFPIDDDVVLATWLAQGGILSPFRVLGACRNVNSWLQTPLQGLAVGRELSEPILRGVPQSMCIDKKLLPP